MNHKRMRNGWTSIISGGVLAGLSGAALADLRAVPGLNEVQAPTAAAIETVCPQLAAMPADQRPPDTPVGDLFLRCREMIRTSNLIQQDGRPTSPNLGSDVSNADLRVALQAIAAEEMAAQARTAIEAASKGQANAIRGRLSALRAGAKGLAFNGVDASETGLARWFGLDRSGGAAGDELGGKLGAFLNVSYNEGDKDGTSREDGFDFDATGVIGGVDYRFTDSFTAGVALSWSQSDVDFVNNLGKIETDNHGGALYATWSTGALHVDAQIGFLRNDYDSRRNIVYPTISRVANGSTDGDQWTYSLGAGYELRAAGMSITPYGRLDYLDLDIDGFRESGSLGLDLDVGSQQVKSFQSALGARLAWVISTGSGVFSPYVGAEWNHEFKNDSASIVAKYAADPFNTFFVIPTDQPDRNYFTLSGGLSAVFAGGVSAFLNLETVTGLRGVSNTGVTAGVRLEF